MRDAVLAEARSWLRTPYHHLGMVKGVGCDCATFIACVFMGAGAVPPMEIEYYALAMGSHSSEPRYLNKVLLYAEEIEKPDPADIVLWRIGRSFSHGAIVVEWPQVIHAVMHVGVVEEDVSHDRRYGDEDRMKFFTLRGGG